MSRCIVLLQRLEKLDENLLDQVFSVVTLHEPFHRAANQRKIFPIKLLPRVFVPTVAAGDESDVIGVPEGIGKLNSLRMVWKFSHFTRNVILFKEEELQTASIVASRNTKLCNWGPAFFRSGGSFGPVCAYIYLDIILYINMLY